MCGPNASYSMTIEDLTENDLTGSIIGASYEVYNTLGFGFLEHLYIKALERELLARGHLVEREVRVTVIYKGEVLGTQRLDMVVDRRVVVEVKSTYELHRAATRQGYNYLRASNLDVQRGADAGCGVRDEGYGMPDASGLNGFNWIFVLAGSARSPLCSRGISGDHGIHRP